VVRRWRKGRKLTFHSRRFPAGQLPSIGPEVTLLDAFTDANLVEWNARGALLQEYLYQWYFELESQRATYQDSIRDSLACCGTSVVPLASWGRQLDVQYVNHPLSSYGSLQWVGGRFNYGRAIDPGRFAPFPALYLAEDAETAYREYFQVARAARDSSGLTGAEFALARERSYAWVRVTGAAHNAFDATTTANLSAFTKIISGFTVSSRIRDMEQQLGLTKPLELITTPQTMLSSLMDPKWRHWPSQFGVPANSQVFGRLLIDAGFEAVLYRSTKSSGKCLAVFTRQLHRSPTEIEVVPPGPPGLILATLSAANCALAEQEAKVLSVPISGMPDKT
jgi:hypothetical protein